MSEIKKLIERLCPDGVEYKRLGDITEILRGRRLTKKELTDNAEYPVYHGGIEPIGYYSHHNRPANTVMIINVGASAGTVGYCNKPFWSSDGCYCIDNSELLSDRYLYYVLSKNQLAFVSKVRHAGIPTLDSKVIANFEIPVPPIEVQRKIVEILDNFTELEAELEAKLEAELEARRKQYVYYRNQLLTFDKVGGAKFDVKWMKLGEIGEMIKGSGIQKSDFVEDGYPCIHYGQLHTFFGTFANKNKSFIKKDLYDRCKKAVYGDLIIASTSEDVEACCKATAWLGGEVAISGDAHIFHHNQNPKYIAYFFQTDDFAKQKRKYASGVKVVRVSSDNLAKIVIPIPSMEEQERIVSILDRFEALTTDLQSGLPAEIEARRKQYEYYREKLLTFKRKTA